MLNQLFGSTLLKTTLCFNRAKRKDFIIDDAIGTAHRRGVPIARSCRLTHTSRSSFYRRVGNPGKRVQEDDSWIESEFSKSITKADTVSDE